MRRLASCIFCAISAAQTDDRDGLFVVPLGVASLGVRALRPWSARRVGVKVLVRDPPIRAAARNELQLHPQIPRTATHRGGGDGLVAGSTRRLHDRRGRRVARLRLRRGCDSGRGRRQRFRCSRGCGARCLHITGAFHFNANELAPDRHHLADLAAERDHRADDRRRNLHGCLVGHHVRKYLILGDRVARLHSPRHEFHFGDAFADIRHLDHMHAHVRSPSRA